MAVGMSPVEILSSGLESSWPCPAGSGGTQLVLLRSSRGEHLDRPPCPTSWSHARRLAHCRRDTIPSRGAAPPKRKESIVPARPSWPDPVRQREGETIDSDRSQRVQPLRRQVPAQSATAIAFGSERTRTVPDRGPPVGNGIGSSKSLQETLGFRRGEEWRRATRFPKKIVNKSHCPFVYLCGHRLPIETRWGGKSPWASWLWSQGTLQAGITV